MFYPHYSYQYHISVNLPVSNSKQIRALPAPSRPQTPKCYSRMTSLPSSPLIHSPLTRNLRSPICLPSYQSSHGLSHSHGVGSLGTPARTIRDYDESQREIKKENFNLKLRIFFLEERLALGGENSNEKLIASNIDLKVKICGHVLCKSLSESCSSTLWAVFVFLGSLTQIVQTQLEISHMLGTQFS